MATRRDLQIRQGTRRQLDRWLLHRTWPARIIQIAIGAWLILSTFLWPHLRLQSMVAWSAGGLTILLSLGSAFVSPLRLLLGLVGFWLFIGTFMQQALIGTLVNNFLCAVAIVLLSFAPTGDMSIFRRAQHRREAH